MPQKRIAVDSLRVSTNETNPAVQARLILKLLKLHHDHRAKLERLQRGLVSQVAARAERMVAAAGDGDARGPTSDEENEWPGLESAAAVARAVPQEYRGRLISAVVERLPSPVAEDFLAAIYSFEALPMLPAMTIQSVLRRTDKRVLSIALLGASQAVSQAVTANMSRRAAAMLTEDMESLLASGELRTRDVREARNTISSLIREAV